MLFSILFLQSEFEDMWTAGRFHPDYTFRNSDSLCPSHAPQATHSPCMFASLLAF